MYGDWEHVDEHGTHLNLEIGYRLSITSSDSLTDSGREPVVLISFTDTVLGVKWNGEIPWRIICEAQEEQRRLDNEN